MVSAGKIPRWLVENDPSWEKVIDSNIGVLRWTKKGTGIQVTSSPTDMYCTVVGSNENSAGLADIASNLARLGIHNDVAGAGDITKYLSSRYLNQGINSPPRFDIGMGNLTRRRRLE
jgi:hypothetical protein